MRGGGQRRAAHLTVRTSRILPRPIDEVWISLCDSRMQLPYDSPLFCMGLPKPVECRLPEGPGGVGAKRECVSVDGVVHQEITQWHPPQRLAFRMIETDLIQRHVCKEIIEQFDLEDAGDGMTRITRTTEVTMRSGVRRCAGIFVRLGLKNVHHYVFKNWAIAPEAQTTPVS
jgi:hypothetical protein